MNNYISVIFVMVNAAISVMTYYRCCYYFLNHYNYPLIFLFLSIVCLFLFGCVFSSVVSHFDST